MINADAIVARREIGDEKNSVLVIEDLLTHPQRLIDNAAEARFSQVEEAVNYYPGLRAPAPPEYARSLVSFLRPLIEESLGVPTTNLSSARCAFSIASMRPRDFTLSQSLPHFDTADEMQVAAVHYLCDPKHGGTAFYRHRATGFEAITPDRSKRYLETLQNELREQGAPEPRYVTASGPLFEQAGVIDAKFNRIIVYKGNLLHSGMVNEKILSPDPRLGRLTTTLFARFA